MNRMELFNEYHSSELQFMLSIYALNREFSFDDVCNLLMASHVYADRNTLHDSAKQILKKWEEYGFIKEILEKDQTKYSVRNSLNDNNAALIDRYDQPFVFPISAVENEYLKYMLETDEAKLFSCQFSDTSVSSETAWRLRFIKYCYSNGRRNEYKNISKEVFRTIINAIYEKKYILYEYETEDGKIKDCGGKPVVPYRIEFSAFDGRWWLIIYIDGKIKKLKLDRLKKVTIDGGNNTDEEEIKSAINQHLSTDFAILHVTNKNNAFERCYLLFENMPEMTSRKLDKENVELKFRYYDWDKELIIKKLLYLGKYVTLVAPSDISDKIRKRLESALMNVDNSADHTNRF